MPSLNWQVQDIVALYRVIHILVWYTYALGCFVMHFYTTNAVNEHGSDDGKQLTLNGYLQCHKCQLRWPIL